MSAMHGDTVKVSIVIPVYNGLSCLEEAVSSVIAQEGVSWELILVNDASSDGSEKVCIDIAKSDYRITALSNPSNEGIAKTLNRGIGVSKGDYVMVLHQDCRLIGSDWLSKAVNLLHEKNADCLIPTPQQEPEEMSKPDKWFTIIRCHYSKTGSTESVRTNQGLFSENKADVFKREALQNMGGFDETFRMPGGGEDQELAIRLSKSGLVVVRSDELQFLLTSGEASTVRRNLVKESQYGSSMRELLLHTKLGVVRIAPGTEIDSRLANRIEGVGWMGATILILLASLLSHYYWLLWIAIIPVVGRLLILGQRSTVWRMSYALSAQDIFVIPFIGIVSDLAYFVGMFLPSGMHRPMSGQNDSDGEATNPSRKPFKTGALNGLRSWLWSHIPFLVLVAAFIAYVLVWTDITILRYEGLHAYVWDLGLEIESAWLVVHGAWTPAIAFDHILWQGFPYLFFWIGLDANYQLFLIALTIGIGLTVFPLYGIASMLLKDNVAACAIAMSYLVYFPAAGANWYDFHYEAFFPLFFVCAYYFFLKGRLWLAFALFMISGLVQFPYEAFPAILGATFLFGALFKNGISLRTVLERKALFGLILMLLSGLLLILTITIAIPGLFGVGQVTNALTISQGTSSPGIAASAVASAYDKTLTILLPLIPLLFLPLFSPRWLALLAPYVGLVYITGHWSYIYPYAFMFQYIMLTVPFLYIGTIEVIASEAYTRKSRTSEIKISKAKRAALRIRSRKRKRQLCYTVLCATIAMALIFEPYGPFNQDLEYSYQINENTTVNATRLSQLQSLISLIPKDSPYVMFQDNLPELLPRPLVYSEPLVPGGAPFMCNVSKFDALNGTFPIGRITGGCPFPFVTLVKVDYVLCDLSSTFTLLMGEPSMLDFVTLMYDSGGYGILGEAFGFLLMEWNYTGPVQYYAPMKQGYLVTQLFNAKTGSALSGQEASFTNTSGGISLWDGPYSYLAPGEYSVTYHLATTNSSASNMALIQMLAGPTAKTILYQGWISGSNFTSTGTDTNITITLYVNSTCEWVQYIARSYGWRGTLTLEGISVRQILKGSTTFVIGISARDDLFYSLLNLTSPSGSLLTQPDYYAGIGNRQGWTISTIRNGTRPDYVLVDPSLPSINQAAPGNPNDTLLSVVDGLYQSGSYGILGEASGFLLLEKGYHGQVKYYLPLEQDFPVSQLFNATTGLPLSGQETSFTNTSGGISLWDGPYSYLAPGEYSVTYHLATTNSSVSNKVLIQMLAGPTARTILYQGFVTGSNFTSTGTNTNITTTLYVNSTYEQVQHIARSYGWNGTFTLTGISIEQVSKGSTTFVIGVSARDDLFYSLLNLTSPSGSILTQPDYVAGIGNRQGWTISTIRNGTRPDYVLVDPSLPSINQAAPGNPNDTLLSVVDGLYQSGSYGIMGEASGFLLLEKSYTGRVQYYLPLELGFSTAQLFNATTGSPLGGQEASFTNTSGGISLWDGPYSYLAPGEYSVTYHLATTNSSASNMALIQMLAGPTAKTILYQGWISGSNFTSTGTDTSITLTLNVNNSYEEVQYIARSYGWKGVLTLYLIDITEESAVPSEAQACP